MSLNRRILLQTAALGLGLTAGSTIAQARVDAEPARPIVGLFTLRHADGRDTAYRAMAPQRGGRWPVVLFSHGANSSNADYDRFWGPWAERGYLVIGANHIDTGPPAQQRKLGRSELWRSRLADAALPATLRGPFDAFADAHGAAVDWDRVCAAGHSFGAVVAQALAGAALLDPGDQTPVVARLPSVVACIALSPPGPLKGFIPPDAWAPVRLPSLIQTGDADVLPGFVDDWRLRLTGFAGRPDRWTIVGRGVDHYFGGLTCRLKPGAGADLPALEETARLSGAFLDAYLRGRPQALEALRARANLGDDGVLNFAAV